MSSPNLQQLPNQPDMVESKGFNLVYFFRQWTTLARVINGVVTYLNSLVPPTPYAPPTPTQTVTSNVYGVVYQNTGAVSIRVTVTGVIGGSGGTQTALTDSSNPPTTVVAMSSSTPATASPASTAMSFEVLPGNFYEVTTDFLTITTWAEWT